MIALNINVYCASGRNGVRGFAVYIIVIEDLEASVDTTSYWTREKGRGEGGYRWTT